MRKWFGFGPRQGNVPRDVRREVELHLELLTREFEEKGLPPDEARRAALAAFGDQAQVETELRALRGRTVRTLRWRTFLAELRQDLAGGWRGLRRAPVFALVALGILALGIGANVAVFSVVRSVLLRPLPYPAPDRLVAVWTDHRARGRAEPEWFSPPEFRDYRDGNRTFDGMAAYGGWAPSLTGAGEPETLLGTAVSGTWFEVLGVTMAKGRGFTPADDDAGAAPVVVLTDGLWRRRFGANPGILGQSVLLSGVPWTVVGILPADFRAPVPAELYRPLRLPAAGGCSYGCVILQAIGRLKPGVTLAQAHDDLAIIADRLAREHPDDQSDVKPWLVPLQAQLTGPVRPALLALMGAVGFVLLLACANLAGLLVVRGGGRLREFSVRAALGAGRGRIVRQLITENMVLAVAGAVLGFLTGWAGARVLGSLVPPAILSVTAIRPDAAVVGFTIGITALAGLLFATLPALQAGRSDLMGVLRSSHSESGRRAGRMRSSLVVVELAIAVVLLVGAGLLLRTFLALQTTDLGYRTRGLVTVGINFPGTRYATAREANAALTRLLTELRARPEIGRVEVTDVPPLTPGGDQDVSLYPDGRQVARPPGFNYRSVTPGYLALMEVRLRAGRMFTDADRAGAPDVVIVNEAAARKAWPDADPLGRTLTNGGDPALAPGTRGALRTWTVVGVVATGRHDGPNAPTKAEIFWPLEQMPVSGVSLILDPAREAAAAVAQVRGTLQTIDPELPLAGVGSLGENFAQVTALPRYFALIVGAFALAALLLALIGVYGVMAYVVSLRSREIGVRLALGAAPEGILRWLLSHGARLTLAGLAVGITGAAVATRVIGSLLYGVGRLDPVTFAGAAVLLAVAALAACWLPARRARRVDPMSALRAE